MNIFAKVTKNPDFFPYLCLTYNSLTVDIMEQLLHYLWKYRLYRSSGLVTTRGDALEILDPGIENTDAGPDFFNAKIKLNGTVWAGSVEIHRKASDWWQHGHSADKAYDNVILHVVEQDDGTIFRRNQEEIPQLVLPVPETVISNMEWLLTRDSPIACLERLPAIDPVFRVQWTDALLAERLERKTDDILRWLEQYQKDWNEVFYILLCRNFGFGVNSDAFERLARSLQVHPETTPQRFAGRSPLPRTSGFAERFQRESSSLLPTFATGIRIPPEEIRATATRAPYLPEPAPPAECHTPHQACPARSHLDPARHPVFVHPVGPHAP